ncbi:hypothetical protein BDZ45DRAFT_595897, partial [Acephala macrosclerotiorum]
KYDFPRDSIGFGRKSLNPKWPNGAKIAVSFVINYEEGAERSALNGNERSENGPWEQSHVPFRMGERATNVESDYDYGSRVDVWRLVNLFERHKMSITTYAVRMALEKNPEVAKAFVDGGHEAASHAYQQLLSICRWVDYHGMKPEEKAYIVRRLG